MDRYTDQERAFCVEVYFQEKSYVKVQRAFRRKFKVPRHKPVPSWKSVKRWIANFRESGRVSDKKRPGKKGQSVLQKTLRKFVMQFKLVYAVPPDDTPLPYS